MKTFRFTKPRGTQDIALIVEGDSTASFRVYGSEELYPLQTDRYHKNLPNLFLDVLDFIDGGGPVTFPADEKFKVGSAPSITLRTLCRRAARAAADGSGNARRFSDAKDLWEKIESHILSTVVTADADPIIDVLKSKNWRKNQPFASVSANPQAWYIIDVFSRSNQQKNPISVYRGVTAVFDTLLEGLDDLAASEILSVKKGMSENLCLPTYAQLSEFLNDSNMLVFHNEASLATWIREETKNREFLYPGTPATLHLPKSSVLLPGDTRERTELDVENGQNLTVSHLANKLSPKKRQTKDSE